VFNSKLFIFVCLGFHFFFFFFAFFSSPFVPFSESFCSLLGFWTFLTFFSSSFFFPSSFFFFSTGDGVPCLKFLCWDKASGVLNDLLHVTQEFASPVFFGLSFGVFGLCFSFWIFSLELLQLIFVFFLWGFLLPSLQIHQIIYFDLIDHRQRSPGPYLL